MSKGTVRFSASALAGGRVGTARIREQVAGSAARLASDEHVPLDAATSRMVAIPRDVKTDILTVAGAIASGLGMPAADVARALQRAPNYSPIERMQRLGRLPRGKMNKTEAAYVHEVLDPQMHAGEILWYRFEAIKLRLADNTFITIDFPVITAAGALEFREVKGRWTDDARAKTKIAAAQYPFRFLAIQRDRSSGGWRIEDLTSKRW